MDGMLARCYVGTLVRWYVRMGRHNSSTNVPTDFTCISIQMVVGTLVYYKKRTLRDLKNALIRIFLDEITLERYQIYTM